MLIKKAPEDARAFVIIVDILLIVYFVGYKYFKCLPKNLLEFLISLKIVDWTYVIWVVIALITWILNKRMLKAYTFEKEKKYQDEFNIEFIPKPSII